MPGKHHAVELRYQKVLKNNCHLALSEFPECPPGPAALLIRSGQKLIPFFFGDHKFPHVKPELILQATSANGRILATIPVKYSRQMAAAKSSVWRKFT